MCKVNHLHINSWIGARLGSSVFSTQRAGNKPKFLVKCTFKNGDVIIDSVGAIAFRLGLHKETVYTRLKKGNKAMLSGFSVEKEVIEK
jgi:hypothetical protein